MRYSRILRNQVSSGNHWVLKVFGVIAILLAYLSAFTDRMNFWTIDGDATRWAGIAVYVIGDVVRLWPVYVLKDRFSGLAAIQPGHTLETRGIYRVIRNPNYLSMLINAMGWELVFRSGAGVADRGVPARAACGPHACRGAAAEGALRRGVRGALQAQVAAGAGNLLRRV